MNRPLAPDCDCPACSVVIRDTYESRPTARTMGLEPSRKAVYDFGMRGYWVALPNNNGLAFRPDDQETILRMHRDGREFRTRISFISGYDV